MHSTIPSFGISWRPVTGCRSILQRRRRKMVQVFDNARGSSFLTVF
jgi:hypothetical protein